VFFRGTAVLRNKLQEGFIGIGWIRVFQNDHDGMKAFDSFFR